MPYLNRRERLIKNIPNNSMLIIHSGELKNMSADLDYPFVVNKNFYYFTGINENNSILVIIKGNNETKVGYFTEYRDPKRALWIGERIPNDVIQNTSKIDKIYYLKDFYTIIYSYLNNYGSLFGDIDTLYFDSSVDIENLYTTNDRIAKKIKLDYPNISIKSLENEIFSLRMIKDNIEVNNIKDAINITEYAIYNMMKHSKECNNEYEIESYFIQKLKFNNTTESFKTICASGANATILHYEENNSKCNKDDLILCDLGCLVNNYASDITRTFPVGGKFTDIQKQIYNIVLKANKECINFLKPGVSRKDYEYLAYNILFDGLKELGLVKEKSDLRKYYYHSVGHLLGLDVHDVGEFDTFTEGMVVTCEPGLYIKELGIGIRIEDDVLITKEGHINLSESIIKEVDDIEALMK